MDRSGLLAILAFLLTLIAGLGPVLGLSPALAACSVALLLGVFSLDQFFFQGRLSTLVVGLLQERQRQWRIRVALHEAGHLLVAHRLGLTVEDYTLGAWETFRRGYGGSGGVVLALPTGHLTIETIEAYCATWLAGGLAERLHYPQVLGAGEDLEKIRMLLSAAGRTGNIPPQSLRNRAERRARGILTAEKEIHETLAAQMLRNESIENCLELLGASSADPLPDNRSTC